MNATNREPITYPPLHNELTRSGCSVKITEHRGGAMVIVDDRTLPHGIAKAGTSIDDAMLKAWSAWRELHLEIKEALKATMERP
jgi:hypothetical protein